MKKYSKPLKACPECRSSRAPVRALLKQAAHGEREAYLTLAGLYFDLISEHLYLCNYDRRSALQKTELLLRDGWKNLPYLKRLSDWERFLARSLMAMPVSDTYAGEGQRPRALVELDGEAKFALIAFDLENWSYPWLSLALRMPPRDLKEILFETRCRLLQVNLPEIKRPLRRCLELVSADLDGQLKTSQKRQLLGTLCSCEKTKAFKSNWLDYRCQLIELRQQIRLQSEERDRFLQELGNHLVCEEMAHPTRSARFRNLFSFRELETTELISGDFRFER